MVLHCAINNLTVSMRQTGSIWGLKQHLNTRLGGSSTACRGHGWHRVETFTPAAQIWIHLIQQRLFFFSPSQFYSDVPHLRVIHPFSTAFEAFQDHLGNSSQISRKRDDSGDSSDLSLLRKSTLRGEEKLKQHDWECYSAKLMVRHRTKTEEQNKTNQWQQKIKIQQK